MRTAMIEADQSPDPTGERSGERLERACSQADGREMSHSSIACSARSAEWLNEQRGVIAALLGSSIATSPRISRREATRLPGG